MPSFQSTAAAFYNRMQSPTKHDFMGTLMPADEGEVRSYEFTQARLLLRVPNDSIIETGDEILDYAGRRFVLGDHDETRDYKVFRAIQLTHFVPWVRNNIIIDPVTKVERRSGPDIVLGPIWVAFESLQREERDSALNVKEETKRIITRHPLKLGDRVNNLVIKRLENSLGITVGEAQ